MREEKLAFVFGFPSADPHVSLMGLDYTLTNSRFRYLAAVWTEPGKVKTMTKCPWKICPEGLSLFNFSFSSMERDEGRD